jgi:PD-(D/E)XK nuclease superfamily protein
MQLRQANPRTQGDLGELAAMEWLGRNGYNVWAPLFHSRDVDLIAPRGAAVLRVQVKTSTALVRENVYMVSICTSGGNQSWNRVVKKLDPSLIDYLFVLVASGRRWFIPAAAIVTGRAISLGGPKYAEYEVEGWAALAPRPTLFAADFTEPNI